MSKENTVVFLFSTCNFSSRKDKLFIFLEFLHKNFQQSIIDICFQWYTLRKKFIENLDIIFVLNLETISRDSSRGHLHFKISIRKR